MFGSQAKNNPPKKKKKRKKKEKKEEAKDGRILSDGVLSLMTIAHARFLSDTTHCAMMASKPVVRSGKTGSRPGSRTLSAVWRPQPACMVIAFCHRHAVCCQTVWPLGAEACTAFCADCCFATDGQRAQFFGLSALWR